jgi:hypothetical protein
MAGYDQDVTPDQQQGAEVSAQPQPARPPAVRWINGGPSYPHMIGNGEPIPVMMEVDGTPGSSVTVQGIVKLANNAWFASATAYIPPQGPGFATLVFQSLPTDLSMPGHLNEFEILAIGDAGQVSRQDTYLQAINMPTPLNPNPLF